MVLIHAKLILYFPGNYYEEMAKYAKKGMFRKVHRSVIEQFKKARHDVQ